MSIKMTILQLEKVIKQKFSELNAGFCVSRRNMCVHMELENSIFSYSNYANMIVQINKSFEEKLADKFVANYLQLIHTAKWKFEV